VNADDTADQERTRRMNILECPQCYSHRAIILDCHPPKAECADCGATYKIRTIKPHPSGSADEEESPAQKKRRKKEQPEITPAPAINARDFGALTDFINKALQAGPEGLRKAQREANRFARRFGLTSLEPQWFVCTPWLKNWAEGNINTNGNTHHTLANFVDLNRRGQRDSRLRARAAISWRSRWLCNYAMSASKVMACRYAKVSEHTADYHIKNDVDFAAMAEAAKAHAIDLLHTRCFQRALEGDIEPIYWQGIKVDHVRKFDGRLQIEMLRAHLPGTFKTPGSGPINIDTGDKILVMDEATRGKLIAARREALLDMPTTQEGEAERRRKEAESE
jgi:transcription initiation factor TFIIIB Brf1 subunit/transcription initiation factor TFIIB